PAFSTNTVDDNKHVLTHSGARGVIISNPAIARRALPAAMLAPELNFLIAMENLNLTQQLPLRSLTGGEPKGVMLTHGSILCNIKGAYRLLKEVGMGNDVFLSFLPLSHSYEHTAGQFLPISIGAQIYYAESIDKLTDNMAEAKPTIMTAVPRLYEVIHQRIQRGLLKATPFQRKMFDL